jgi:FkbM family methyltransferase
MLLTHKWLRSSALQPIWERLHFWTLFWMNHGAGGDCRQSGEEWVLANPLRSIVKGAPLIFDVGANRGAYLHFVKQYHPQATVYCFEPVAETAAHLRENGENLDSVEVVVEALSDRTGEAELYDYTFDGRPADALASLERRLPTQLGAIEIARRALVRLNTVDHFCAQHRIEAIDLLKIDVEGHDLAVLRGAQEMIRRGSIRMIQFEFGPANLSSRTTFYDFWSLLSDRYVLFRILPTALRRIERYEEWKEVYLTTNYLAVQRSLLALL